MAFGVATLGAALRTAARLLSAVPTRSLALVMAANGVAAAVSLIFFVPEAPYGRYSKRGWGFFIPPKVAWLTQEMWSFVVPAAWLAFFASPAQRARAAAPANALALSLYLFHYFYRGLVYPLRTRGSRPTPVAVWALAAVFCCYNGFMQAKYFLTEAPLSAPITPRVAAGAAIWAAGWAANYQADNILINLRKPGETGYKIPRGGLFDYVSAANYAAELAEWAGWALAVGSAPAAAFAFFTLCNLGPRAWRHHQWYKSKFEDYPADRKAFIPFVL